MQIFIIIFVFIFLSVKPRKQWAPEVFREFILCCKKKPNYVWENLIASNKIVDL